MAGLSGFTTPRHFGAEEAGMHLAGTSYMPAMEMSPSPAVDGRASAGIIQTQDLGMSVSGPTGMGG